MPQQIKVQTPELALAAAGIGRLSKEIGSAKSAITSAQGQSGAFGGEPIGATFLTMCSQASRAAEEYGQTIADLSRNVAMASLGYVTTDEGVIPVSVLASPGQALLRPGDSTDPRSP